MWNKINWCLKENAGNQTKQEKRREKIWEQHEGWRDEDTRKEKGHKGRIGRANGSTACRIDSFLCQFSKVERSWRTIVRSTMYAPRYCDVEITVMRWSTFSFISHIHFLMWSIEERVPHSPTGHESMRGRVQERQCESAFPYLPVACR